MVSPAITSPCGTCSTCRALIAWEAGASAEQVALILSDRKNGGGCLASRCGRPPVPRRELDKPQSRSVIAVRGALLQPPVAWLVPLSAVPRESGPSSGVRVAEDVWPRFRPERALVAK